MHTPPNPPSKPSYTQSNDHHDMQAKVPRTSMHSVPSKSSYASALDTISEQASQEGDSSHHTSKTQPSSHELLKSLVSSAEPSSHELLKSHASNTQPSSHEPPASNTQPSSREPPASNKQPSSREPVGPPSFFQLQAGGQGDLGEHNGWSLAAHKHPSLSVAGSSLADPAC